MRGGILPSDMAQVHSSCQEGAEGAGESSAPACLLHLLRRADLHQDFIYKRDFLCVFSQSDLLILAKSEEKHCQRWVVGWVEGRATASLLTHPSL